jgi:hypothetical protein
LKEEETEERVNVKCLVLQELICFLSKPNSE